jgi:hypothetical protein|uniref:Uncharacterized protein n=1 Tax=Daphnia galeata TaxID=27404 RepID=A0A8J2S0Z9_9CRUS|nr:unnamed protein product [Daphnia galeata]
MQKLRPPTWRRSRTPTPVEMRSSGPTASCSAITSSSSLDMVSRQASSTGPVTDSQLLASARYSESAHTSKEGQVFLCLPVDQSSVLPSNNPSNTNTNANNRGRSRSFDFSHHQEETGKSLSVDLGANAQPAATAAASSGSGPLLGMLRRSFSRHSSTSDGQRSTTSCVTSGGAFGGSLSGAGGSGLGVGSTVCIHCLCVEEYERLLAQSPPGAGSSSCCLVPSVQTIPATAIDDLLSESEYDSNRSSSCGESAADDPQQDEELDGGISRLSFLGESFECRQKVEPWIRENENQLAPDPSARAHIRRGRSLGLASDTSTTVLLGAAPNLRRGGSECQPDPSNLQQEEEQDRESWSNHKPSCQISFNFSFSSSEPSTNYQVSDAGSTTPVGGRRSPGGAGTPRLERQEALCSGWLGSEPSLELLAPGHHSFGADTEHNNDDHSRQVSSGSRTHASMETHASISLEVDSGACVGVVQQASLESQYSFQLSLDVHLPESARQRISSFESETSVDSMASSNVSMGGVVGGGGRCSASGSGFLNRSSLLARRKCLSAGASPSSSPPICLSNSRYNLCSGGPTATSNSRLNLCTGSSSEYGDQADLEANPLSPSPPAEIYLTVPVLAPLTTTTTKTASSGGSLLLDKSRHLRERFRRHDSSKSSSDKDRDRDRELQSTFQPPPTSLTQRSLTACSSLNSRSLSRGGDSLHPRSDLPFRSRSIEIGLPTAHRHHHHHHHHSSHHHRTEYHDLAGSARRQQWVSRLKYVLFHLSS